MVNLFLMLLSLVMDVASAQAMGMHPDGGTEIQIEYSSDYLMEDERLGVYNYCPSVVVDDTVGIYYCSNSESYVIEDSIFYRELENDFKPIEVLSSTSGSWDSVHVCDPSVVEGNFKYDGIDYKYLMSYLGCSTTNNQQNQIGLAVSNSKDSGWIKVGSTPLVQCSYDSSKSNYFQWGVGQPSLISIGEGIVLLFYTEGTWCKTSTKCAMYDLSDLNNIVYYATVDVSNEGLLQRDGVTQDFLSNGDFALTDDRLYVVCDVHPFGDGVLNCVPRESKVYSTLVSDDLLSSIENAEWVVEGTLSDFDRNHNCGLMRDVYGRLYDNFVIQSFGLESSDFVNSLWTYRMWLTDF